MAQIITNTGKAVLAKAMINGGIPQFYISVGTNPSNLTSAVTDIALFKEYLGATRIPATASITTTTTTKDTLTVSGVFTASGTVTISEAGLTDSATQPAVGLVQAGSSVIGSAIATQVISNQALSPGNNNYIQIRTEVMQVVSGSGSNVLNVLRAQMGTTPISTIAIGDPIVMGNVPGSTAIAGGDLIAKYDFTGQVLTAGASITLSWPLVF